MEQEKEVSLIEANTKKKNKRIEYIDIMKAIGIILVIMGHTGLTHGPLENLILSFHMPLFFFAYGLAIKPKEEYTEEKFKAFFISRVRGLLVPYFIWAFVWAKFTIGDIISILYGASQFLEFINPHLWFLPCMFVASIIFELVRWIGIRYKINKYLLCTITIIICMILCIVIPNRYLGYPFGINIAICATIFIALGYIIKDKVEKIDKVHILIAIMIVTSLGLLLSNYNVSPKRRWRNYGTCKIL